ncbi:MAG: hypothetical protein NVSMB2_07890 [Chloroflexota bacterium]
MSARRNLRGARGLVRVLTLGVVWLLAASGPSAAGGDGSIAGQIVNRSAGGIGPGGSNVLLVAFGRKEQAPLGQQTAQADETGHYAFTGLDRDPNIVYITLARFGNVNYPADAPVTLVDNPAAQADIGVYESTMADDAVQFDRLNLLLVGAQDGILQFMEMGTVVNTSDRTFMAANPQDGALARALKFALPPGALGAQMQSGFNSQDMIAAVGGIQITSPVLPGRHDFALSFQVPYTGTSADLTLQLPYPTGTYNVYLPDTGYGLDTNGLTAGGQSQLGGQSYALYSANNVAKSTVVGASLKLSNGPGGSLVTPAQLAAISLGVVLLVLGGGVLLFGTRRREAAGFPAIGAHDWDTERLELVVRLAALDERYAAGDIGLAEYEDERERGKERLRHLTVMRRRSSPATA